MLARLSKTCSRLADLHWNVSSLAPDDVSAAYSTDDFLPPEANALSQLSLSVPENALESVTGAAGVCGRVFSPFYQFVGSTLSTDVEKLVLSLHEADPNFVADLDDGDEDIYVVPFPSSYVPTSSLCIPTNESSGASSNLPDAGGAGDVPESPVPQRICAPRIVITPAPPQHCREMSSCVPVQDTSFGARLTVPTHSTLNSFHPPMASPSYPQAPLHVTVRSWMYRQGHWCAVVPALDEQERRGIFSRPFNARRRALRKRAGGPRDISISYQNVFARNKRDS